MTSAAVQILLEEDFVEARESFKKLLVREFSVENLLFFTATRDLEEVREAFVFCSYSR